MRGAYCAAGMMVQPHLPPSPVPTISRPARPGAFWNWDPRQTTILCLLLIYAAYLALRSVTADPERRARVSAVYALFSFLAVPFLVFVIPRFYFSLHPEPVLNAVGHVDMEPVMLLVLLLALADVTLIYLALLRKGAAS